MSNHKEPPGMVRDRGDVFLWGWWRVERLLSRLNHGSVDTGKPIGALPGLWPARLVYSVNRWADVPLHANQKRAARAGDSGGWIHRLREAAPVMVLPRGKTGRAVSTNWPRMAKQMFMTSGAAEYRAELAVSLGLSVASLEQLGVGLGHDSFGRFSSWPERDALRGTVGIVRRYPDARKRHIPGGTQGLYIPQGWSRAAGPIFLPEGGSDTAALVGMGLCAVRQAQQHGRRESAGCAAPESSQSANHRARRERSQAAARWHHAAVPKQLRWLCLVLARQVQDACYRCQPDPSFEPQGSFALDSRCQGCPRLVQSERFGDEP